MTRIFCFILLFLSPFEAFPTRGPQYYYSQSGSVKTMITIEDISTFEIEKINMCGDLCNNYLRSTKFKDLPVFIFYIHTQCLPEDSAKYFLSFDKGRYTWINKSSGSVLDRDGIVIRLVGKNINPRKILEILEYGLDNIELIKHGQKKIKWNSYKWQSIDISKLHSLLELTKYSDKVDKILCSSYDIKSNLSDLRISWCNEKYVLGWDGLAQEISIPDIYEIINLDSSNSLVFKSRETFFHIDRNSNMPSSLMVLPLSTNDCFRWKAIIDDSLIYLRNENDYIKLINSHNIGDFKLWRFSISQTNLDEVSYDLSYLKKFADLRYKQRVEVSVELIKK